MVNLQLASIDTERNTKAQKDKKANKFSDVGAKKFNLYAYPIIFLILISACLALKAAFSPGNYSLLWLVVVAVNFLIFSYHFYWIVTFDANYLRGAQRWRFHFFLSDVLISCVIGIQVAVLLSLSDDLSFFWTFEFITLMGFTLLMIDKFAAYRRVLLFKLSLLWAPLIALEFSSIFTGNITILDNGVKAVAYSGLLYVLIAHARLATNRFWNIRESEYLIRLKSESYQAAHHSQQIRSHGEAEFIEAFSQELKIQLDSVLSGIHLLKDTPISLQQKELLDMAGQAGERTINLIDTVVDYSLSSKKIIQSELVIFPVVRELEQLFVSSAREGHEHGLDTNFTFDKHLPQRIKADKSIILKTLALLLSCVTRLNVSGNILIHVGYQSVDTSGGLLSISITDLINNKELIKEHPLIEKLSETGGLKGAVALNYLMAESLSQRLGATIAVQSELEGGVGIEISFPVEAKSGSTPEFYPNANLKGKNIGLVNCPDRIKSFVSDELNEWGILTIFYDVTELISKEEMSMANSADSVNSLISSQKNKINNSANKNQGIENSVFKDKKVEGVMWFSDVIDENIFEGESSTLKNAISKHDVLNAIPVFVIATDRQIQSSLHRQFLQDHPGIHVIQRPLQLQQFHELLVDALFNIDFHAHHVLNRIFSLDTVSSKERILLVEDHRVNQMVAQGMLKRLGYNAKIANNGAEALKMLEDQDFDLILMDCQMAEMDGFTATEKIRIREKSTDTHIPIIALTANTTEEDQNKCLAVGMDDYLSKPVRYTDLEHSLKRWLDDGPSASVHH